MGDSPAGSRSYPDPDTFARVVAAFDRLREVGPDERQQQLLALDPAVAAEVRRLLALHDDAGGPLGAPEQALDPDLLRSAFGEAERSVPRAVGPYRLIRKIGRGGMGTVWLGEREGADFEQQVAIKLLRLDAAAPELQERFRVERRILAGLKHPNIAALLDGGTTEDGSPYVVMEYVDGSDLLQHAERLGSGIAERLQLFCKVCAAVNHAHRNLVVHRDLKPANILVTAAGEPKLLDFGIAKLLESDAARATPSLTMTGAMLLTPEYASPEQVRGEPVTTATDVYALGAVLYELLTGRRAQQLATRSPRELEQVVCERDPVPPSVLLARPDVPTPAAGLPRHRLVRRLAGDLDVIVLQALHKDPARRYPGAAELAADLQRHLRGEPVLARPDTFGYRARKFLRRNRWPVATAAAFVLVLVAATIATAVQAARIAHERDLADKRAEVATETADFMVGLFEMAEPDAMRAEQLSARAMLDRGSRKIRHELADAPEVRAALLAAMGSAYTELGLFDAAAPLLQEADAVLAGADVDPFTRATVLQARGNMLAVRSDSAAEPVLRRAVDEWRRLGADVPAARAQTALALLFAEIGRFDEALELAEEAHRVTVERFGPEANETADALVVLASVHRHRGEYDRAGALLDEAQALQRRLFGEDHPAHARTLRAVGELAKERGDYAAARAAYEQTLAFDRRVLGDDHPDVDNDLFLLAMTDIDMDELDVAERRLQEVLARDRERLGDAHPYVALDLGQLASVNSRRGDFEAAEKLFLETLALQREHLEPDHPELATTLSNLGVLYRNMGEPDRADAPLREALEIRQRILEPDHPVLLTSRNIMAVQLAERGEYGAAEAQFRAIMQARIAKLGEEHDQVAGSLYSLAYVVRAQGRIDETLQLLAESERIYRKVLPPEHVDLARPLLLRADIEMERGQAAAALPLLREVVRCRSRLQQAHPARVSAQLDLARCLIALDQLDEAAALVREQLPLAEQAQGPDSRLAQKARDVQQQLEQLRR